MARNIKKISKSTVNSDRDWNTLFEELYREYFPKLYAYSRSIVDSQSMAKDIVSEFFYKQWLNKEDFEEIQDIEMYFFVSIRNQSFKSLRKAGVIQNTELLQVRMQSVDYVDPEELLLEKELLEALESIISELPDQCQLIFRLSKEKGLKNAEIAAELGISVVTVNSQKKKAVARLKAGILKYYHDHDDLQLPDIRLISQLALLLCCNIYN